MDHTNILNLVRTTYEVEDLKTITTSLLNNIYKEGLSYKTNTPYQKYITLKIIEDLEFKNIKNDISKTEAYLKSLNNDLKKIDTIKITIAIKPTTKLLEKLNYWVSKNTKKKTIFDITIEPKILGGAIISDKKGVYRDFSLQRKIDATFQNHQEEILSNL